MNNKERLSLLKKSSHLAAVIFFAIASGASVSAQESNGECLVYGSKVGINIRQFPTTKAPIIDTLHGAAEVKIFVEGEDVAGDGSTDVWAQLDKGFVHMGAAHPGSEGSENYEACVELRFNSDPDTETPSPEPIYVTHDNLETELMNLIPENSNGSLQATFEPSEGLWKLLYTPNLTVISQGYTNINVTISYQLDSVKVTFYETGSPIYSQLIDTLRDSLTLALSPNRLMFNFDETTRGEYVAEVLLDWDPQSTSVTVDAGPGIYDMRVILKPDGKGETQFYGYYNGKVFKGESLSFPVQGLSDRASRISGLNFEKWAEFRVAENNSNK